MLFPFFLFLLSPIFIHQSVLYYFIRGDAYSQTIIRVTPGCFIFYQSHLLLLQYRHVLFLNFFNRQDCSFPQNLIRCSSKNNFPWLLLRTLCSEDNHRIIGTGYLYLNRSNFVVLYIVDFFSLGSRIYLDEGSIFLGIFCKVVRDEGG